MAKLLTAKGYAIEKASLKPEEVLLIKSELTVSPKVMAKFNKVDKSFPIFLESRSRYYLPRAWAEEHFGPAGEDRMSPGLPLPASLTF